MNFTVLRIIHLVSLWELGSEVPLPRKDLFLALESHVYLQKTAVKEDEVNASLFFFFGSSRNKDAQGMSEVSAQRPSKHES